MPTSGERIAENVQRVRDRIRLAARRGGRDPQSVRLVAVTKYVGLEQIKSLLAAGCRDLGESRPQQLWDRASALEGEQVNWHLVGPLQRNKVRRTAPFVSLLHSGDSPRTLAALDRVAAELGRQISVLLQVNVSGEVEKHGFDPDRMPEHLPVLAELQHVRILGLMGMASRAPERASRDFARLVQLRQHLSSNCPPEIALDELSMGMSGDFEQAIELGATIVRIGSALFEGIP